MDTHPPDPWLVHRLPPAPHFVGREPELDALLAHWRGGAGGVVGLIGLGGAGKTAVAARFLEQVGKENPPPHGLLVWSFYQEPEPGAFLQTAHRYFAAEEAASGAKGASLLHLLGDALSRGGPHLLVLDGLERVQLSQDDAAGSYGQVEEPLLKRLLQSCAEQPNCLVLVTSRFPLTDLQAYMNANPASGSGTKPAGYRHIDIGGLSEAAAIRLLRARGVLGDDADLENLIAAYGAHALTLDHLGGLIGQFLGGDPCRAPEAPALASPSGDRQALRLARLLRAYEQHLPAAELALLCRLCLLRRSANIEQIAALFLCTPGIRARTVRALPKQIRQAVGGDVFKAHELDDLAESIRSATQEVLAESPLAGPANEFVRQIIAAVETFVELRENSVEVQIADLAALYLRDYTEAVTGQRPLSAADRRRLRELCSRYLKLAKHPLMQTGPAPALKAAFQQLGYRKSPRQRVAEDYHPADLTDALERIRQRLRYLAFKHLTLSRTRELCQLAKRKWELAGPLAPLDRDELVAVIESLVARHLVLPESDGSLSVHPAVRDHFGRLGDSSDSSGWHDVIREQLISLVQRPGKHLPEEPRTLDLVEEAIYHALQSGRSEEAVDLYENVLGGLRHSGWKLGEMARGLRILRGFPECPDRWALGWFLRALGEYEEAYAHNPLPCFRADVRLLQGRLPHVAAEGDETRTAIAAFLMGETRAPPPARLGCAIPRDQCRFYQGDIDYQGHWGRQLALYEQIGWQCDLTRSQVIRAETMRSQGDRDSCRRILEVASRWILHSGSVEHLCLLQLANARLERDSSNGENAQRAVDAGIRMARQCGLGLYLIELLCEQAEICLARADYPAAAHFAGAALERAHAPDCQFLWGAANAGSLLGWALLKQGQAKEARAFLAQSLARREQLGDPKLEHTQRLLQMAS